MAASNLFMSYVASSWQPLPTGTAISLDEITEVDWDASGEAEEWYADGSFFPRLILVPRNKRTVKLTGGNVKKLLSLPQNSDGTFTTTLQDAVNGTGTGAINFTLTPCKVLGMPNRGQTGKFATGDVMINGYAPDGLTDPLSYTVVS